MADQLDENPTYLGQIRHFFEDRDLSHMYSRGIDISTYQSLKTNAIRVYFQTRPPNAAMPPPSEDREWSQNRSNTFFNWIKNDYPLGEAVPQEPSTGPATRIRKDTREIERDPDELATLKKAFEELMQRPPEDPDGYFALAGIHWYPIPADCEHHVNLFNPWHRAYLARFEDALRTVAGCEQVTLPYWDITGPLPDFLSQPPFDAYTLPKAIHPRYPAGYTTARFDASVIERNVVKERIPGTIDHAMSQSTWEEFVTFTGRGIEAAHDSGHGACGPTISNTDVAAFDPLFWFFHSNWDRLWWRWQQIMSATTQWSFRSTIMGPTVFLEDSFNILNPFSMTSNETIDLSKMDMAYTDPASQAAVPAPFVEASSVGSRFAARGLRVHRASKASVRLKGINRLSIPGSFRVVLHADGQPIGQRTFFQSTQPMKCANCLKTAHINLDFLVEIDEVVGKQLSAVVEVLTPDPRVDPRFPLHACGNPTLNVRLLLHER